MSGTLLLGTQNGIWALVFDEDQWRTVDRTLHGHDVWAVCCTTGEPPAVWAGTYGDGLLVTRDGGSLWKPVELEGAAYVRAIFSPLGFPETLIVGIEPAEIWRTTDDGRTWACAGLRSWPEAASWYLPYSPRAGAVRTFAAHPATPARFYAGIEVGGVLRSDDGGNTWRLLDGGVHPDVHHLAVHPAAPETLLAATGGGVYRTRDGGQTWECVVDAYTRAVAYHPLKPEVAFAGPARHVGRGGRILATKDGGDSWILAATGLPVPMPGMVEAFYIFPTWPDLVFAVLSDGRLVWSGTDHIQWQPIPLPGVHVRCCALLV